MNKNTVYIVLALIIASVCISAIIYFFNTEVSDKPTDSIPTPTINPDPKSFILISTYNITKTLYLQPNSYSQEIDLALFKTKHDIAPETNSSYIYSEYYTSKLIVNCTTPSTFYVYTGNVLHAEIKGSIEIDDFPLSELHFGNPNNNTITITMVFHGEVSDKYVRDDCYLGRDSYNFYFRDIGGS